MPALIVAAIVMITKIKRGIWFWSLVGVFILEGAAFARNLVELESKYLGDGLFQYTLTFPDGRYFQNVKLNALNVPFVSFAEFGQSSSNWSGGQATPASVQLEHAPDVLEQPPYQAVLLVRSAERTFRLSGFGESAVVTFGLYWYSWATDTVGGALGFGRLPCLVPCKPDATDGSSSTYFAALPGPYPDLKIQSLILSNDVPVGFNFSAGRLAVAVEASSDLVTWKNIGSIESADELGVWTAPSPLPDFGNYFRLRVGPTPVPPAPALSSVAVESPAARASASAPISALHVAEGTVEVQVKTQAGRAYRVSLAGFDGREIHTQTVTASADTTAVKFPDQDLPNPCYVKAIAQ